MNISDIKILLVDDQPDNLNVLAGVLGGEGYDLRTCLDGASALENAQRFTPDLILLDVTMPGMDGFEVCRRLKADPGTRDIPVIFITGRVDTSDIVNGFQIGGVDYILKPFKEEELKARVATQVRLRRLVIELTEQKEALEREIAQRKAVVRERDHLTHRLSLISEAEAKRWGIDSFIGKSKTIQKILTDIERLQQSSNTSVLITGASGTGKELIARAIHFGSNRAKSPFVPVNCSAVPHELADSLFFGYSKGAFTGADSDRIGYFEIADGGTLFLDEIGAMPLDLQAKLLRVLEDRKVLPVGAKTHRPVDVRILSATNADLDSNIHKGEFRQDLYYRLAGYPVQIPPLRERKEDIPLLVQHFLALIAAEMGLHQPGITPDAIRVLSNHGFPGNIRELKNIIERALIDSEGQTIEPAHLNLGLSPRSPEQPGPQLPADLPLNIKDAERVLIKRALAETSGNIAEAARLLGIHRTKIYRRLAEESHTNV
jgi:DNA-binding NtrC family response regulator